MKSPLTPKEPCFCYRDPNCPQMPSDGRSHRLLTFPNSVITALLQRLWTKCVSNSLYLSSLISPPLLPKDWLLFSIKSLLIIYNSLVTWATIYNICHLWVETSPKTEWNPRWNLAWHLYSSLESPTPFSSSRWCVQPPTPPLCQVTCRLCWSFDGLLPGQENPVKAFRRSEHPRRILEEQGYLLYDLTCL